ncbi:MAG: hypothetical protein Q7S22_03240, partial [Candidatus Micrarchaeota archaeon]|nr:hypothetical protein [Candidatus Micrarchaeota archaeon]
RAELTHDTNKYRILGYNFSLIKEKYICPKCKYIGNYMKIDPKEHKKYNFPNKKFNSMIRIDKTIQYPQTKNRKLLHLLLGVLLGACILLKQFEVLLIIFILIIISGFHGIKMLPLFKTKK